MQTREPSDVDLDGRIIDLVFGCECYTGLEGARMSSNVCRILNEYSCAFVVILVPGIM